MNIHKIIYFLAIVGALIGQGQEQTVGLFLNTTAAAPGYTLFAPMSYNVTYLIDNNGELVQSWFSDYRPGLSVYFLENGDLLRTRRLQGQLFQTGGRGGGFEIIDWDGELVWEFDYFSDQYWQHHDIEPLPNGNVLLIAWELKADMVAIENGRNPNLLGGNLQPSGFWPDHIIEVNPESDSIVWEWHVWDHLIQDYDSSKLNYGVVSDHPELVNINYPSNPPSSSGDWLHINAVDYNMELDQILLSVHHFGEIWIIDHSTTTAEAANHTGGNSGKGGDLLYRWGNPQNYRRGDQEAQLLGRQHDPRWIPEGFPGAGNILVFNNNEFHPNGVRTSVFEIIPPITDHGYVLENGRPFGPDGPVWSYSNTDSFFSPFLSGTHRMQNGNTFITSGPRGRFLEVTSAGKIVWDYWSPYSGDVHILNGSPPAAPIPMIYSVFRATKIPPNHPGLAGRELRPLERQPEVASPGIPD